MTSFGQSLIDSANEALAFARGEDNGCVVHIPPEIDTARIREKIGMSQKPICGSFACKCAHSARMGNKDERCLLVQHRLSSR